MKVFLKKTMKNVLGKKIPTIGGEINLRNDYFII